MKFLGKTKKEIIQVFGLQNNDFNANEWVFTRRRRWFFGSEILHLEFNNENKVIAHYIN